MNDIKYKCLDLNILTVGGFLRYGVVLVWRQRAIL